MQSESTSRFAGGIKSCYDLAMNIDHLAFAVDSEASQAIVQDGCGQEAAWNGGVWILYFGEGFPKSESWPASTKALYFLTVPSSALGGIFCNW